MAKVDKLIFRGSFPVLEDMIYATSIGIYRGANFGNFKYWCNLPSGIKLEPDYDEWAIIFVPSVNENLNKYFLNMHNNQHFSRDTVAKDIMQEIKLQYTKRKESISMEICQDLLGKYGRGNEGKMIASAGHYMVIDGLMAKYPDGQFPRGYSLCSVNIS